MRKVISLAIIIALFFPIMAKTQTCQELKGIDATSIVYPQAIAVDAAGNSYAGGWFLDTIHFDQTVSLTTSSWNGDGFIVCYSVNGNIPWVKKITAPAGASIEHISVSDDGYIYAVGAFRDTAFFDTQILVSEGSMDGFVMKLNPISGAIVWLRAFGGANWQYPRSSDVHGSTVFLTGEFETSMVLGSTTVASAGDLDVFVCAFDTAGNPGWISSGGSSIADEGQSITADSQGNCYVTGIFSDGNTTATATFGSTTLPSAGYADVFFAKYSQSGSLVFAKSGGGPNPDGVCGICVNSFGDIVIAGGYTGSINFGQTSLTGANNPSGFIVLYAQNGVDVWARNIADNTGYCRSIAAGLSGDVFVLGTFVSSCAFGPDYLTSNGGEDIFIARINQSGICVGALSGGSDGTDEPHCITTDALGDVYVVGDFAGSNLFSLGPYSINNNDVNSVDGFVAKISFLTTTSSTETVTASIIAYPNPFVDHLRIDMSSLTECEVMFYDALGRKIKQQHVFGTAEIECTDMPSGFYTIYIVDEKGNQSIINVIKQ